MELRPLGTSGVMASVIGLGAWPMGGEWWGGSDDAEWMPCRPIPICSHQELSTRKAQTRALPAASQLLVLPFDIGDEPAPGMVCCGTCWKGHDTPTRRTVPC
jgi:hypothetical protein